MIRPPGSKSITNRALVCAALAAGPSRLLQPLNSDDTRVMMDSLHRLGIDVQPDWDQGEVSIRGGGGQFPCDSAVLHVGNSGTTIRFLTAACCLGDGEYRLTGVARMHERPIQPLVSALNRLGADVISENHGCPPVRIHARGLRGGNARISGETSSQFASAILMALPYARDFSVLQVNPPVVSKPYIDMTCSVMSQFGVDVTRLDDFYEYSVEPGQVYDGTTLTIEPDASAASYFWAAAAITGGDVTVPGLGTSSMQGDVRFAKLLEEMGCEVSMEQEHVRVSGTARQGIDVDMSDISDTAQTLAAVALFVEGPTTIRGIAHNRFKETDRIADLATELRKAGAAVDELTDGLRIVPGELRPAAFDTYEDHRMAMSLSLVGLKQPGIEIKDPGCVRKTYPSFFEHLASLR